MRPVLRSLAAAVAPTALLPAVNCKSLLKPSKTSAPTVNGQKIISENDQYVYLEPATGSYVSIKVKKSDLEKSVKGSKVEVIGAGDFQREVNSSGRTSRTGG